MTRTLMGSIVVFPKPSRKFISIKVLMKEMVDATVAHLTTFKANYAARLMSMSVATRFVVYGKPDSSVLEALEGFGAAYMSPIGGFVR